MATDTEAVIEQKLQQGIELARSGDKSGAEILFDSILSRRPNHEEALLWKAAVSSEVADTIACLERVLRLNPTNQRAKAGLDWARKRQSPPEPTLIEADEPDPLPKTPPAPLRPVSAAKANEIETKSLDVPYKKGRLNATETDKVSAKAKAANVPPVVSATAPAQPVAKNVAKGEPAPKTYKDRPAPKPEPKAATGNRKNTKTKPASSSQAERASLPRVAFTVSERVISASRPGGSNRARRKVQPSGRLMWPLALFGGAILLAMLAFVASSLAGVLGIVALAMAVAGLILFNQAEF